MTPSRRRSLTRRKWIAFVEQHWLLFVWIVINSGLFYNTYVQYKKNPKYFLLRSMLGSGLCISRGSATALNINCCLVLLPKCRAIHSLLCRLASRDLLLYWLQNTKVFHIAIAATIAVFSAHIQNAINFSKSYNETYNGVNWANYRDEHPCRIIFRSLTGISGVVMLVTVTILTVTSCTRVRRARYNLFWYTHRICYLFLFMFLVHPLSGILKEQINVPVNPGCVNEAPGILNKTCLETIVFRPIRSDGWLWLLLPISIHLVDHAIRFVRRNGCTTHVISATKISHVLLLTVTAPHGEFSVKPGQFVLVQCPEVSRSEWHPFTVARCPTSSQGNFQLLVSSRGDWTRKLCRVQQLGPIVTYHWPPRLPVRLVIDGPYHSPMEQVLHSTIAICIAGGIGITPFMANLEYLLSHTWPTPQHVHLVWVVRHVLQIDWCVHLVLAFHNKCWMKNEPDRFTFNIYVTGKSSNSQHNNTIIRNRLRYGRPQWYQLFQQWNQLYQRDPCHVFACGPKTLTKEIKLHSNQYKKFKFVRESF